MMEKGQNLTKKERNVGIELLRITAMLMIVVFHIAGMFLNPQNTSAFVKVLNMYLNISTCSCVDIFAMISGYILVRSSIRLSRIIELWLQCFFYSAGICVILYLFGQYQITTKSLFYLFPIFGGRWWYMTAYFGILLFIPIVNKFISEQSSGDSLKLLVVFFMVYLIGGSIFSKADIFRFDTGLSPFWLLCCYVCGALLRTGMPKDGIKKKHVCLFLFILQFVYLILVVGWGRDMKLCKWFIAHYNTFTAPTVFLQGVCLLILFSNVKIENLRLKNAILAISPLMLGVYLIHMHPVLNELIKKACPSGDKLTTGTYLTAFFCLLPIIFLGGILADYGRSLIFRIAGVREFSGRIENRVIHSFSGDKGNRT